MKSGLCALVVSLSVMLGVKPAIACRTVADLAVDDIKYANLVVIGRVIDYEIVLDQAIRERRKKTLEHNPDKSSEYFRLLSEQKKFLSDYARFKVVVDEVLVGEPISTFSATWDNSTFSEPEMMGEGPYLIGLREPGSKSPPLRGPSAARSPSPEPSSLTVLQAPCAPAFIFDVASREAEKVRKLLGTTPQ